MVNIDRKARFYKALAEPVRLRIIQYLLDSDCDCICHIQKHIKKDQSVVFRHIQILKDAGILMTVKKGNFLMCRLKDKENTRSYLG